MMLVSNDIKLVMKFEDIRPTSTNEMYRPAYTPKTRRSFLRKSSELVAFQSSCQEAVKEYHDDIQEFISQCKSRYPNYLGFSLKITVGLPMEHMFYKRTARDLRPNDTSNLIKSIEDVVSSATGFDDKYNMEVSAQKVLSSSDKWEFTAELTPLSYLERLNLTEQDLDKYEELLKTKKKGATEEK